MTARRPGPIASGLALAALAAVVPAVVAASDDGLARWSVGPWTIWRIEAFEAGAAREYASIRLGPSDRVLIDAGGCAKDALVSIPGVTAGMVPVATVLRRELRVPETSGPAALAARPARPCSTGWLMIGVRHSAADEPLPLPRPMDLVSSGTLEENGLPLNPKWGLQQTEPGALPNPVELCFDVPGWFDNPVCTVQRPSVDRPVGVKGTICAIGATTPINGHVNWFPATYTGPVYWDGKFWSDQDINVRVVPPDQSGLTTASAEAILCEFDARETLNHFATPWWKELRRAANRGQHERGRAMVDGRPAVVTGLVGLDCEHDCGSEIHPVWAMGVRAEAEAGRETWALFARNWGNEGFCSSEQHHLELAGHRITLTLPWRPGATRVRLGRGTRFFANVEAVSGWWSARRGRQVEVTFQLPAPEARGRVHGEIVLVWSGAPVAPPPAVTARPGRRAKGGGPERLAQEVVDSLTPRQRQVLDAGEAAAAEDHIPVRLQRGRPPALPAEASLPPAVSSSPDPARDVEDLRRLRRLLEVYPGPLPGALQALPALLAEQ